MDLDQLLMMICVNGMCVVCLDMCTHLLSCFTSPLSFVYVVVRYR